MQDDIKISVTLDNENTGTYMVELVNNDNFEEPITTLARSQSKSQVLAELSAVTEALEEATRIVEELPDEAEVRRLVAEAAGRRAQAQIDAEHKHAEDVGTPYSRPVVDLLPPQDSRWSATGRLRADAPSILWQTLEYGARSVRDVE